MFRLILSMGAAFCLLAFANVTQAQAARCLNNLPVSKPTSQYQDHGDGTVTDTRTGLMWKKCSEGQTWNGSTCTGTAGTWTWPDALSLAESLNYADHSDWHLPSRNELESLVEDCTANPSINTEVFPNTPPSYFWSASPYAYNSGSAWYVNFSGGDSYNGYVRYGSSRVRVVRGGQ